MDIKCAVCGEPWNCWGANHGDMAAWEYDLFKKGAGCPCCKGESDRDQEETLLEHLESIVYGSEDPDSFTRLHNLDNKPKWEEPEPKKLWTCDGCGVSTIISNEIPYDGSNLPKDKSDYLRWYGGEKVYYSYGNGPFAYSSIAKEDPIDEEEYYELEGEKYCPGCASNCVKCGAVLLTGPHIEFGDTYDSGNYFPHPENPSYGSVCIDCYLELTTEYDKEEEE